MKSLPRQFWWVLLPLLWLGVLGSAAGAIYAKHRARELFIELEQLNHDRDELNAEWGRLQLEQSAWSTYAYVENVASTRLHMVIPTPAEIKVTAAVQAAAQ